MITHKHHIIPRHMGGSDDNSNLVELTIEEHAEAHRKLFEEHGRWQDKIAWQTLSGQITHAEAIKQAQIHSNKTRIVTQEHKDKISKSLSGRKNGPRDPSIGRKISESLKGKPHTEERKANMRKNHADYSGENNPRFGKPSAMLGKQHKKVKCPHCKVEVSVNTATRWHFDNCKSNSVVAKHESA